MILVLLGTQNNSFHRLLEKMDELINKGIINEKVIVQSGYTNYESKNGQNDWKIFYLTFPKSTISMVISSLKRMYYIKYDRIIVPFDIK